MKLPREIGQKIEIIKRKPISYSSVAQKASLVKSNFGNGCLKLSAGIPSAAPRTIEAPAKSTGVRERGVYDVRLRYAVE